MSFTEQQIKKHQFTYYLNYPTDMDIDTEIKIMEDFEAQKELKRGKGYIFTRGECRPLSSYLKMKKKLNKKLDKKRMEKQQNK